ADEHGAIAVLLDTDLLGVEGGDREGDVPRGGEGAQVQQHVVGGADGGEHLAAAGGALDQGARRGRAQVQGALDARRGVAAGRLRAGGTGPVRGCDGDVEEGLVHLRVARLQLLHVPLRGLEVAGERGRSGGAEGV